MAEYVIGKDEDRTTVARRLLAQVGPERADQVVWIPRADVNGGGVFIIPDEDADAMGRAATTEQGTPKDAEAAGEYPYDGDQEGDAERRAADKAAMGEAADSDDAAEAANDEEPPVRRRRSTKATNGTAASETTDQQ